MYTVSAVDVASPFDSSKRCVFKGTLGSRSVLCLLDSGATCNLVDAGVIPPETTLDSCPPIHLCLANKSRLAISNCMATPLILGESGPWSLSAAVAPAGSLVYDVILGTPFMFAHNVVLRLFPETSALIGKADGDQSVLWPSTALSLPQPRAAEAAAAQVIPPEDPWKSLLVPESPEDAAARQKALAECSFSLFDKGIEDMKLENPANPLIPLLVQFRDLFPDALPRCLPPDRGKRNHTIDLIPGKPLPQRQP